MHWGEIVDNVSTYAYLESSRLVIVFGFWRETHPYPDDLGKIFFTKMDPDEFVATVREALDVLAPGRKT